MKYLDQQLKLANEAVWLIKEFRDEASKFGLNFFKDININAEGKIVEVNDDIEGVKYYSLNEVGRLFNDGMRGFGICKIGFYEFINLVEGYLADNFNKYPKEEFEKYSEDLKDLEDRYTAIYKRLQVIEKEVKNIESIQALVYLNKI